MREDDGRKNPRIFEVFTHSRTYDSRGLIGYPILIDIGLAVVVDRKIEESLKFRELFGITRR